MVKVCVKRLRRKIEPDPGRLCYVVPVRGVCYRRAVPPTPMPSGPPPGMTR